MSPSCERCGTGTVDGWCLSDRCLTAQGAEPAPLCYVVRWTLGPWERLGDETWQASWSENWTGVVVSRRDSAWEWVASTPHDREHGKGTEASAEKAMAAATKWIVVVCSQ